MSTEAQAWFLYPGSQADQGTLAQLRHERFVLPEPRAHEVLAEPLYGSWEGNYNHALMRDPVDICHQRNEPRVILGNAGVVRILATGADVQALRAGDCAMIYGAGEVDRFGHMARALAYDARQTMGCMATRMIVAAQNLIKIPEHSRYSRAQWAAFSIRYVTAWSNWHLAYGVFRLQVPEAALPRPNVWGWGGGSTFAELDLARRHGCRSAMISGDPKRLAQIEAAGLAPIDRRAFADLATEARTDAERAAYKEALRRFLAVVEAHTGTDGVQIFVDYIGTPVIEATLRALGRCGVITTAGWKEGMSIRYRRALACIQRHQYIHTHYASRPEAIAAMAYGEAEGWMPTVDQPIVPFAEIPSLAARFAANQAGYFPIFAVNPE